MAPTKSCSSIDISDSPWDQLDRALQTCGLKHINLFFESVPLWTCSSPLWTSHSSGNPSMLESPLHSRLPLPSYVQWPPRDPLQRIQRCHTLCDPTSSLNPWCRAPWLPSVLHFWCLQNHTECGKMMLASCAANSEWILAPLDHNCFSFYTLTLEKHFSGDLFLGNMESRKLRS